MAAKINAGLVLQTYIPGIAMLPNNEQKVQESDATKLNSSTNGGINK